MKKIILILFVFISTLSFAQKLSVTADKNPAIVGEQILIQYSIDTEGSNFKSPNFNGLRVLSGPNPSTQSSYSFVNGKSQSSTKTTYSYYLKATKEGTAPYSYVWNTGDISSSLDLPEGSYQLTVTDVYGCSGVDDLEITYDAIPTADVSGGGSICDDGETTTEVYFNFNGLLPWNLVFTDGNINYTTTNILLSNYTHTTNTAGSYEIIQADDLNNCIASNSGVANVIVNPLPVAVITPSEVTVYENETVELTAGTYTYYEWYTVNDSLVSNEEILTVSDSGSFYIWVQDENGCEDLSEIVIVNVVPITQLFIPNSFTPNNDEHNELFVIKGMNVVTFSIKIFDRWGEQLFESDSIDKYWDGKFNTKKVQQGAYYYNIEVLGEDKQIFEKSGEIKVIY